MMKKVVSSSGAVRLAILPVLAILVCPVGLARVVRVTSTIQAAVDEARSGDTVFVPPGVYRETVLVNKSNITITGSTAAILDATGFTFGIRVGTGRIQRGDSPACPPLALRNVTIRGLTIQNASFTGVFMIGVDGFRMTGSHYVNNDEYGPFPVCSRNGRIDGNFATGHNDAAIYVGDDDHVVVEDNLAIDSVIGIEIENSSYCVVRNNTTLGNTAGILAVVLPGLPMPFTSDVLIEKNVVIQNNLPNPFDLDDPTEVLRFLPAGAGIANFGGDRVVIRNNEIVGNNSAGIAIVSNLFAEQDPRIEPFPDNNRVLGNVMVDNGSNPDSERLAVLGLADFPGADVLYDGTGVGTCFAGNTLGTDFPPGITGAFPCPDGGDDDDDDDDDDD